MTDSSHHELGKWLACLLQPVLERFSSHCVSDSLTFAKSMQNLDIDPNVFMCAFDVSSLFTNIPLGEIIKICSEALYDQSDFQPGIELISAQQHYVQAKRRSSYGIITWSDFD